MGRHSRQSFILSQRDAIGILGVALAIFVLTISTAFEIEYLPFGVSSLLLLLLLFIFSNKFGLISLPTMVAATAIYPLLVPFITRYIYRVPHFTIRAVEFESDMVANKITTLGLLTLTLVGLFLLLDQRFESETLSIPHRAIPTVYIGYDGVSFSILVALFLGSAFLIAPGPTILTAAYEEGANTIPGWAIFLPAVYKAAWALLFVIVSDQSYTSTRYRIFSLATALGTVWLLLHGRRVESAGLVLLYFADIYWHRLNAPSDLNTKERWLIYVTVTGMVFVLALVGRVRKGTPSIRNMFGLNYGGGFVGVPGGGHGIYGTSQATYALFGSEYQYLLGKTFLQYPIETIPTGVQKLIGVAATDTFREFLATQYKYNGGNYIMNVYYANFGVLGHLLVGVLLGLLVVFMYKKLQAKRPSQTLTSVVAVLLFINIIRAVWYSQLYWVDSLQGLVLVLPVYVLGRVVGELVSILD